jgi:16S rRNA processing protein RimM
VIAPAVASPPEDLVVVGRVLDAWGLKGGLKIQPFSEDARALLENREWWFGEPGHERDFEVVEAKMHGQTVTARLVGVADREVAEGFRGQAVSLPRARFPGLDGSEYYWVDLIGLAVLNRAGDQFGEVVGLMENGAHQILEVKAPDTPLRLIPFVSAVVLDVDLVGRRVVVDWQLDY